jgi:imidazolonepropionase-like amidohydrolase
MIVITHGKVMAITQGTLERGTVLVEDGRIVALGEEVEAPEGAEVDERISD